MSTTPVQFCPMLAVAVEMSGAKWLVGSCAGVKLRRKTLSEDSAQARMEALVAEVEVALKKLGGDEHTRVVIAYEAGQEAFWLQRMLISRGMNAEVIDPVSLKVDRRGKRAKTDRLDVEALARALYAWMLGTPRRCAWCGHRARRTRTIGSGSASVIDCSRSAVRTWTGSASCARKGSGTGTLPACATARSDVPTAHRWVRCCSRRWRWSWIGLSWRRPSWQCWRIRSSS